MCYSAQIEASFHQYERTFGAQVNLPAFFDLYAHRAAGAKVKLPKAVDAAFARAADPALAELRESIRSCEITQGAGLEPMRTVSAGFAGLRGGSTPKPPMKGSCVGCYRAARGRGQSEPRTSGIHPMSSCASPPTITVRASLRPDYQFRRAPRLWGSARCQADVAPPPVTRR
jgi:hypothetical protein